jgi:hypothetical protein
MKQITPGYISIKVNGNNPQSQETKNSAIYYRIIQELKFLYAKEILNEQLYSTHLDCAALWPGTWQIIQTTTDEKLHQQMDAY